MNRTIEPAAPPGLKRVEIEGLFGLFDHEITLHRGEGVTIIHGANGVGKTRLLQLLAALPSRRFGIVRRTPFRTLTIDFIDGTHLEIQGVDAQQQLQLPPGRREREIGAQQRNGISLRMPDGRSIAGVIATPRDRDSPMGRDAARFVEMELPFLDRVGPDTWINEGTGEPLSLADVIDQYGEALPAPFREMVEALPDEIAAFLGTLRIEFIDTQRLTMIGAGLEPWSRHAAGSRQPRPIDRTVDLYAQDLSREIERHLTEYADISAKLDRTFPQRALSQFRAAAPASDIRDQYEELTALRERLAMTGILERSDELPWPDRDLDETERRFLALYLKDTHEKLAVFGDLLRRLELLTGMLDQRFLYKQMRIDRRRGFFFVSPSHDSLVANQLSSGEQHELVFSYRLLFKSKPSSLVLIDEPEISLNVAWQQKFLGDLLRIRELTDVEFLIATHSPQIIHDRWDLAQRLGGGVG